MSKKYKDKGNVEDIEKERRLKREKEKVRGK